MSNDARSPGQPDGTIQTPLAPLDCDTAGAAYNLMLAAQIAEEMSEDLLRIMLLGEVRRILRRGQPGPTRDEQDAADDADDEIP